MRKKRTYSVKVEEPLPDIEAYMDGYRAPKTKAEVLALMKDDANMTEPVPLGVTFPELPYLLTQEKV